MMKAIHRAVSRGVRHLLPYLSEPGLESLVAEALEGQRNSLDHRRLMRQLAAGQLDRLIPGVCDVLGLGTRSASTEEGEQ